MSSYYNRIEGTLNTGKTARSSDIHLIQSGIQDAFQRALTDICGTGVVLGETENALKLTPTTQHVDQKNAFELADNQQPGISFYEVYLRQPINIEKSSIERIRLQMSNASKINVTLYGEIRDADFDLVGETNTRLPPTDANEYIDIDFIFNLNHLPLGRYYFVLRPVDVSSVDLTLTNYEDAYDTILPEMFKVKYDKEGSYSNITDSYNGIVSDDNILYHENIGLYASYDGNEYLEARKLEDYLVRTDRSDIIPDKNFDLCFEQIFSSKNTYLINNGAAIVLGEKVYPLDTHVSIDGPSTDGDRTDLVVLTSDGRLNVIKGTVYNGEKIYPVDNTGLKIAYITTYQSTTGNNKVPAIEQDDENNLTRQRDILERLRRLEKKTQYQATNNAPTRIKYNCAIDPVLANNGVDEDAKLRGEGTYSMSATKNENGETVFTTGYSQNYAWSIIENNYSYQYTETSVVDGELTVYDVHMPLSKPTSIQPYMKCDIKLVAPGYGEVSQNNQYGYGGVPYAEMKVIVKKNSENVATYNIKTNNDGEYSLSLWNIKALKTGDYKIYVTYNNVTVKSDMTVYDDNHSFLNMTRKSYTDTVDVRTATAAQTTQKLPDSVIAGNDSFYLDKINLDEQKGEVTVQRIEDTGDYQTNKLLKDMEVFSSAENIYKVKSDKNALTSEYPVLNLTLHSDTHIKTITPYIAGFKNIDKFGILVFKNDFIFDTTANTRQVIQKKISTTDTIFPTVYNSGWQSLEDLAVQKDGYKVPKKQVTFDVDKDFSAGTYSFVIYGHIQTGNSEGAIKLTEYVTRDYKKDYGIATKCIGSSKLSVINMDTNNLTNKSWDLAIEQKPYKYYDTGILISKPIDTSRNITSCKVQRNFKIPNGCKINLFVSNNGGTSWVNANSQEAHFTGDGYSFRWKLEMISSSVETPILCYNDTWKHAISFTLYESSEYIEYEDYQKCYETPLLNANAITRTYIANGLVTNRFSEWEFARLYMEDPEMKSKIDILISYADDVYSNEKENKANWNKQIFFSQIFADLTLADFSRKSVDYDNYDGNVEYDEYNYPFKMESEYIENTETALASPDVYYNASSSGIQSPYIYGDISALNNNGLPVNNIYTNFRYEYQDAEYSYIGNDADGTTRYSGMHITNGPTWRAILTTNEPTYTSHDVINGIRFQNILDITENVTTLTIGLKPIIDESKRNDANHHESIISTKEDGTTSTVEQFFFPPGTFDIVVAVNQNGDIDDDDASNGKAYTINQRLYANKYNEITIDILDDLEGFEASGVGSIGIRVKNIEDLLEGEGIEIGRVKTTPHNRRPYTSLMYTGKWDRVSWKALKSKCRAYAEYLLGRLDENTYRYNRVYYPITNYDKDAVDSEITFISNSSNDSIKANYKKADNTTIDNIDIGNDPINTGHNLHIWSHVTGGSSRSVDGTLSNTTSNSGQIKSTIKRHANEISTTIKVNGKEATYKTNDSGNQTLFYMPANVTGELFKIETNIPYTIYDLIDIEYHVFTTFINREDPDATDDKFDVFSHTGTGRTYTTHGHFSKGDIYINFYDTRDTDRAEPVERFALPAWGRVQSRSHVENKTVTSWFKKRSKAVTIKAITIERRNPRANESGTNSVKVDDLYLVLDGILLFNADVEAALGPQMQMRIYPNTTNGLESNTTIRKFGAIYRI